MLLCEMPDISEHMARTMNSALARAPHRNLAVDVANKAGMRLDMALVHRLGLEAALDDHPGLPEARLDVTQLVPERGPAIFEGLPSNSMWSNRRGAPSFFAFVDIDDERQYLVVDLDQLAGFGRHRLGVGRDGGDRVPMKQRLVARHDVAAHPAHVLDAQHHRTLLDREVENVLGCDDGLHARQLLGLRGVDRLDDGVRMAAPQDLAPDHAGHGRIGGVGGAARHLAGPVRRGVRLPIHSLPGFSSVMRAVLYGETRASNPTSRCAQGPAALLGLRNCLPYRLPHHVRALLRRS